MELAKPDLHYKVASYEARIDACYRKIDQLRAQAELLAKERDKVVAEMRNSHKGKHLSVVV